MKKQSSTFAAMLGALALSHPNETISVENYGFVWTKSEMNKKQRKARAASMRAKKARKIHRK
jgi:hypothetical protein